MGYAALADAAVVLHAGFLIFLVIGGIVAWRWRWVVWLHLAAVAWGVGILTLGQPCPLTALERWATVQAGGARPEAGFVDRYVEDVVYPGSLTGLVRTLVAVVVVISWVELWRRRPSRRAAVEAPALSSRASRGTGRRPAARRSWAGRQGWPGGT